VDRNAPPSPSALTFPKSLELEQRLARNEMTVTELRETITAKDAKITALEDTIAALYRRVIALQAQIDHLSAKFGSY
jgi:uncharacterized coiled-coil protein SlyX